MSDSSVSWGGIIGTHCRKCKGCVKWHMGSRPSHVYAQDFADATGATHPVELEDGPPTHYWVAGANGHPDGAYGMDVSLAVATVRQRELEATATVVAQLMAP